MRKLQEELETVKDNCHKTVEIGLTSEHDGMRASLEEITRNHKKRKADLDEVGQTLQDCHKRAEELQ